MFGNLRTAWKAFNGKHCNWFLKEGWEKCLKMFGKMLGKSLKVYSKWAAIHRWTVKCFRSLQIECHSIRQVLVNTTSNGSVRFGQERWGVWAWQIDHPAADRKENELILGSINPNPTGISLSHSLSLSLCLALLCYILSDGSSNMYMPCVCLHITQPVADLVVVVSLRTWESWQKARECRRRRSRRRGRRGELPQLRLEFS